MKGLGKLLRAELNRIMAARQWMRKNKRTDLHYKNPFRENIIAHGLYNVDYQAKIRSDGVPWGLRPQVYVTYIDFLEFEKKYFLEFIPSWEKKSDSPYVAWTHSWLQGAQAYEDYFDWRDDTELFWEFDADRVARVVDYAEDMLGILLQRVPSAQAVWENSALRKNPFDRKRWDYIWGCKYAIFCGEYDQVDRLFEAEEDNRKWRARFHEKPVDPRDPELDKILPILEQVKRDRGET